MAARWSDLNLELLLTGTAEIKERAISMIREMVSINAKHRNAVVDRGAVPIILDMCRSQDRAEVTEQAQESAAAIIKCLAFNNTVHQEKIIAEEGVEALVELLKTDNPKLQENAAGAMMYLSANLIKHRYQVFETDVLKPLLEGLRSRHEEVRQACAGALRFLVLKIEEHEMNLVDAGGIPLLVDVIHTDDPLGQEHAVGTLRNMVVNNNPKTERAIMAAGAAPRLIELLIHGEPEVQQQTAATLMCLVDRMVEYLESEEEEKQKKGARAIIELAAFGHENREAIVEEGALDALILLLRKGTPEVQSLSARALGNIMLEGNQRLVHTAVAVRIECEMVVLGEKVMGEEGIVQILTEYLRAKDPVSYELQAECAYCLKNIVICQNAAVINEVIDAKAQEKAIELLKLDVLPERGFACEQLCGFLAALAENNAAYRKAVGSAGAVSTVLDMLFPAADKDLCGAGAPDVFGEACLVLKHLSLSSLYKQAITGGSTFDLLRRLYDGEGTHPNVVRDAKALSDFLME
eukprot:TRINITY_DN16593_c0_g1_i3.p1 TRINITY_DN16593_c0_g1~~TRINITY_DN16593_c0_g1_i3.p1  ORF type:complete len:522 (-),score=101.28 TRINITY_DN16593_c0_g1_i3:386-1951(-)